MEGPANNRRPQHAAVVRATHWVSAIGTLAHRRLLEGGDEPRDGIGETDLPLFDELPTPHGAPVRLRVARQLGYKSIKSLSRVTVTDTLKPFGKGLGGVNPEYGYSWWAGI